MVTGGSGAGGNDHDGRAATVMAMEMATAVVTAMAAVMATVAVTATATTMMRLCCLIFCVNRAD